MSRDKMKYVDVPLTGWHRPRPGELEVVGPAPGKSSAPTLPELLGKVDVFLSSGDHPDWLWCVYQDGAGEPTAVAMYRSGQAVPLPADVARTLIRLARMQAVRQ